MRGGTGRVAGIGGVGALIVVLIGAFVGVDLTPLLQGGSVSGPASGPAGPNTIDDRTEEFVSVVLADTEEVWGSIFANSGLDYDQPELVLYSGATTSACGMANAAVGPFYCPGDQRIFLDTSFFATLDQRLGAGGDFAFAYVIAHEVAHHVQNEIGVLGQVNQRRARLPQSEANELSVRIELQADCLAGVWATHVDGLLEPGDIEEALNAARMIGDDRLQRRAGQVPQPHTFTHGTSEQRASWFARGYDSGDIRACNTFSAEQL